MRRACEDGLLSAKVSFHTNSPLESAVCNSSAEIAPLRSLSTLKREKGLLSVVQTIQVLGLFAASCFAFSGILK